MNDLIPIETSENCRTRAVTVNECAGKMLNAYHEVMGKHYDYVQKRHGEWEKEAMIAAFAEVAKIMGWIPKTELELE